jgi:hypothetical protein
MEHKLPSVNGLAFICLSLRELKNFYQHQNEGAPVDFFINHLEPEHVATTFLSSQAFLPIIFSSLQICNILYFSFLAMQSHLF